MFHVPSAMFYETMEINANAQVKAGFQTNHVIDLSDRLYKIILAIIGLIAVYVIGQMMYDLKALPHNYPREIYITGEGKALATPDIATVHFGVNSQSEKIQDSVNENNQKMSAVITSVKDLGVEGKDIKTTFYNLSPVYGEDGGLPMGGYYPYPQTKIIGYRLEQQVEVKIRDLDKINEIIDKATVAGANIVSSPQFTVDDIEKVRQEARANAVEQAQGKALTLASQAGLKIDKLVNISENSFGGCGGGICPYGFGAGGADIKESFTPAPQIEPGQTEVNVSVTLTYRLR